MSHYKAYPAYKDSGVEWLGEVPEHWSAVPFKWLAVIQNGKDYKDVVIDEGGFPVIGSGGEFARASQYMFDGESVLLGRKGTIDRPLYMNGPFWTVDTMFYTVIGPKAVAKYFYYCSLTIQFNRYSTNTALPSMTQEVLGQIPFALPEIQEQQAIVAHLDRETARIDGLVGRKTRFIELLREKLQALITHAVTKGLDPSVKMKDSGVEWLGEVPEHWVVSPIKFLVIPKAGAIKTGPFGSQLTSAEMQGGAVKVYNQRNVIDDDLASGDNYISEDKFRQLASFQVFPGDVLITTRGTIGKVAIVPSEAEIGILHPCLMRVQVDESKVSNEFFSCLLGESHLLQAQIAYLSNASTIEVIYSETMGSIVVSAPSINEQDDILAYLDRETTRIDTLISKTESSIALLRERRSALITAAVTGRIDLRDAE